MTGPASTGAHERAQVYQLLSTIFRQPLDATKLAHLRSPQMLAAMQAAGIDPGAEFAGLNEAELLDLLAIDYTHLFHAPEGKILPFESLMIGGESDLRGDWCKRVEKFMANVGYRVMPGAGELADHISVELAFMADLAVRENDPALANESRQIQVRFPQTHLGRWAGMLAEKISVRAETSFYDGMAHLMADFVAQDAERLGLSNESEDFNSRPVLGRRSRQAARTEKKSSVS